MKHAIQWIRSLVFVGIIYVAMLPYAIIYLPWAILSPAGAIAAAQAWCRMVKWLMGWMVGLKFEVRGTPPTGAALVVGKHQSFLDIILIFSSLPRPKFIMKQELVWAPILGQYALRMGCIPVRRGKRAQAIKKMLADVEAGHTEAGQLIIYPQGTRIPPGVKASYKIGTGLLYREMGQTCYPVACNVGLFWPKKGIMRQPGTAVIEFLDPIEPGQTLEAFMADLENVLETRSNALMREAGFDV